MPAKMSIDEINLLEAHYSIKSVDDENESVGDETESDDDEISPVKIDIICGNNYSDDLRHLVVTLEVNCDAPSLPFKFNVKYGGFFNFSEVPTEEELERFSDVICPFQIYPYIREFVSEMTRKGGNEPLYIPPMNFVKIHEERKNENSLEKIG